jgi:hypothetical protein
MRKWPGVKEVYLHCDWLLRRLTQGRSLSARPVDIMSVLIGSARRQSRFNPIRCFCHFFFGPGQAVPSPPGRQRPRAPLPPPPPLLAALAPGGLLVFPPPCLVLWIGLNAGLSARGAVLWMGLNAGHRWWGARMGLPSPLTRVSWSYNAARGTLLRDSFAVIDIFIF